MASSKASSSSSSSVPTRGWTYDVFLSFRGEDTRNTIVDHLYAALILRGIRVFKDNIDLHKGEAISPQLLKSIEESRFAVIVLSKNYGNSCWCLDELAKIMDCQEHKGQKVLPVFYHVDPSDVRKQKGDFATAFEQHEKKFIGEMGKVNNWREALAATANLSGWHISANTGGEYADIQKIVQEILHDIQPRGKENNLIGIEARINALNSYLKKEATKEVRMVGICGMGGMGKTTIAQALFRRISNEFEGSSFVNDVREKSSSKTNLCAIQTQILGDILRTQIKVEDCEQGACLIEERLCNKKVLLVLDDVHDFEQLRFLAARHEWFGPGSRIIITTRDEHLLSDADAIYKPALLLMDQAIELFSRHSFRENSPPDGYMELSNRAIRYTGRLPLALKVLGSYFHGRQAGVWEDALNRLAKSPNPEIFDALRLSFDGLEDFEKKIFLDIACLFKGEEVEDVIIRLDCCGFHPKIGIDVLIKKSLITVSKKRIEMHDLLQEMGLQIVRKNSPNSRLRKDEEIRDLIKKNRTLEAIEAIVVKFDIHKEDLGLNADVFENMNNLRLLEVGGEFTSSKPTVLPDELGCLHWKEYPFSSLPISHMPKLVRLEMESSKIKHLWKGKKIMRNLKFINLSESRSLRRFPDVSGAPNVERLDLSYCSFLKEVDESVGYLKKLVYLDMACCYNLKRLPSRIEMESLETLILKWCCSLKRFPEVSPCMVKLSHIDLEYCHRIEELPSSIRYLSSLSFLDLTECEKLKKWPEELGRLENLQKLHLRSFGRQRESFIFHALTNSLLLRKIDLRYRQVGEEVFPQNLHEFEALEVLNLSENHKLIQLPAGISHLSRLKHLDLSRCKNLQNVNGLPSGLQVLDASHCKSLGIIDDLSKDHESLFNVSLVDCNKLLEDKENERYLDNMLKESILKKYAVVDHSLSIKVPGRNIPSWFKQQEHGGWIVLKLPPKWQTGIMGFAVCGVYRSDNYDNQVVSFRFEVDETLVPRLYVEDSINASAAAEDEHVCISYIPFSLFQQQMDDDDDDDFQRRDWSHIIEGHLVIHVAMNSQCVASAVRCGAHVVYEEDVESIQQIIPSFPSYWNWRIEHYPHAINFYDN